MPKTLLDRKTNEKERGATEEENETRKYGGGNKQEGMTRKTS